MPVNPAPSSADRIAATRPSIMSLGATMSAPARRATAPRARAARASRRCPPRRSRSTPQWPWSVYSHMQTSVITTSSRHLALERAHRLLHRALVVPRAGSRSRPCARGSRTAARRPRPRSAAAVASRSISSTEVWNTPAIDPTGCAHARARRARTAAARAATARAASRARASAGPRCGGAGGGGSWGRRAWGKGTARERCHGVIGDR